MEIIDNLMNLLRKIFNSFFSSIIGGVFFTVIVAGMLFFIARIYLAYHGTDGGNIIEELQPLAVLIIGLASVFIAARNYWEKLGHNITCRLPYTKPSRIHRSSMPYITNIILHNKKDKVEIIDRIFLFSKKLGYVKLADFSKNPISLKNYETRIIPLEPVTVWVTGIKEKDIKKIKSFSFIDKDRFIINTMGIGIHPTLYVAYPEHRNIKKRMPEVIAATQSGLLPIKVHRETNDISNVFPLRNTDYPDEDQEEKTIHGFRLIMVTELTLGRSASGKEPEGKKIKVLLYRHLEHFFFDNHIDENPFFVSFGFGFPYDETEDFEEKWQGYYDNEKVKFEKNFKDKKNKEGTSSYAQALEDEFNNKISRLLQKQDLPRISSNITSRIFFLLTAEKFGEYPIVYMRHMFFATGFYPTEELHPCFEEVEESIFAKIRKWRFRKTPASSQKTQEQ